MADDLHGLSFLTAEEFRNGVVARAGVRRPATFAATPRKSI
ncbi:hypothetical protein OU426_17565 [Frigidibacter sp. RF13]|nr:hypothetical protein [Frigidibacter sp. RF13]MCY1128669.1 hypothetical protein [Frigidibacter sp. RF13]